MRDKKLKLIVVLFFVCNIVFVACGSPSTSQTAQTQNNIPKLPQETEQQEIEDKNIEILGIVKAIHYTNKTITIYDLNSELDMVFAYTGGTDIRDAHNKMITMDQIEVGEIVDGTYNNSNRKLMRLYIHKVAWTYNGVHNFSINQTDNIITIAKKKYRYKEQIVITDGKNLMEPIDLNIRDELSVKGIGSYIYSIQVTKGHGYIRLIGEDAFLGGTIEVGRGIIVPVVEDMLIVAREGSYRVILENGELEAIKDIRLLRDEEITLDLSEYKPEEEQIGYVDFQIKPIGADLYINGQLVNYAELVELDYGEHVIRVALTGYEDFTGILNIAETTSTVQITLAEATEKDTEEENEDESREDEDNEEENNSSSNSTSSNSSNNSSSSSSSSNSSKEDNTSSSETSGSNSNNNSSNSSKEEKEEDDNNSNSDNNSENDSNEEDEDSNKLDNNSSNSSSGSVSNEDGESNTTLEKTEEENTNSVGSVEIDEEHTITIQGPKGAKVYLNGTLKGTAPITIPKEIGTHTITLSKKGYTTKSYTVEVKNNGEDVTFNFPDMTKVSQ